MKKGQVRKIRNLLLTIMPLSVEEEKSLLLLGRFRFSIPIVVVDFSSKMINL